MTDRRNEFVDSTKFYRCPIDHSGLRLNPLGKEPEEESWACESQNHLFYLEDNLPVFVEAVGFSPLEQQTIEDYGRIIEYYDSAIEWLFESFFEDEQAIRQRMVSLLELRKSSWVLEVGAGTGRDSSIILQQLGEGGQYFGQDLSHQMVTRLRDKLTALDPGGTSKNFFVSPATQLPFEDHSFDAVYSFGGLNEFGDVREAISEITRVAKVGARVVLGDENIAPWLTNLEYADVIRANNPIFKRANLPIDSLPPEATDVSVRWLLGNCFYLIAFTVGAGTPRLNMDLEHKGKRGGTLRTRFYGVLEGIDPILKSRMSETAEAAKISESAWTEMAVRAWLSKNETSGK
jgi:ubiquinone/menaquinone biosynthesis C-methylase UbiE